MSRIQNYLKAGDINRSTRSREIVDYLGGSTGDQLCNHQQVDPLGWKVGGGVILCTLWTRERGALHLKLPSLFAARFF